MKAMRHAMILQLIDGMEIDTQEMLADQLLARGVSVTQATISRDIKELRLVKVLTDHGTYKYSTADRVEKNVSDRMIRLFSESVVSLTEAENLIVIKTLPASAGIACEAIDGLNWNEIAGTLAGENSIFVAIKSKEQVPAVMNRFRAMMK
ncbi:MAG: arginine repressor [Clostridiales bacterium]|nr:arginine repressor [Clostridiales bacterium]MDD6872087.1 arginine repressor [Clostridiales bacterium]MDD7368120.1 arginine repressor [Clostridiales bacterium]MDY2873281.1 arginine repressor [Eubacteriales bacterium]